MDNFKFEVFPQNVEEFSSILNKYVSHGNTDRSKWAIRFLFNYLNVWGDQDQRAKSILVEKVYVSTSYLEDYRDYYSASFLKYKKYNTRLHFFSKTASKAIFNQKLDKGNLKDWIERNYMGYVVLKDLETSIVGPTLLKPYKEIEEGKRRVFNSIHEYEVHVCGIPVKLKTLIFQQQDQAVSACASNALWVSLHATHKIFGNKKVSLSSITKAADVSIHGTKSFPSLGLNVDQISRVIHSVGLVPDIINYEIPFSNGNNKISARYKTVREIRRIIYAYSKCGLPVMLGFDVGLRKKGKHLVVITGYSVRNDARDYNYVDHKKVGDKKLFESDLIDCLYVHDDQVGPFSKIGLNDVDYDRVTPWLKTNNSDRTIYHKWIETPRKVGNIKSLIVPISRKIRITFTDVDEMVSKHMDFAYDYLDFIVNTNYSYSKNEIQFVWNIYLQSSEDYKFEFLSESSHDKEMKKKVAYSLYPKFIWVVQLKAEANQGNYVKTDYIFDSTAISGTVFSLMQVNLSNIEDVATFSIFHKAYSKATNRKQQTNYTKELLSKVGNGDEIDYYSDRLLIAK